MSISTVTISCVMDTVGR